MDNLPIRKPAKVRKFDPVEGMAALSQIIPEEPLKPMAGPEEAQGLQRFWPLHHLAFKFLNLTCHAMCSLHELLCIFFMSCNVLLVCHELC